MKLWWVRHGPTHQTAMVGWRDVPADLSDTARIARLSAYLPRDAPVVSSDLIRAAATADVLADGRTRLPHVPDLREFNFGDWDGQPFDSLPEKESRAFWESPGDTAPPGGESWNDVDRRVTAAVDELTMRQRGRDLILVAHIGVIVTQIARAAGITPYQALGHKIDNLSVTEMTHSAGRWQVGRINHCP